MSLRNLAWTFLINIAFRVLPGCSTIGAAVASSLHGDGHSLQLTRRDRKHLAGACLVVVSGDENESETGRMLEAITPCLSQRRCLCRANP